MEKKNFSLSYHRVRFDVGVRGGVRLPSAGRGATRRGADEAELEGAAEVVVLAAKRGIFFLFFFCNRRLRGG